MRRGRTDPRILQVCAVDFTAFHLLRPLMHACRDAGWAVEFACADGPGAVSLRTEGFRHRRVPMSRSLSPIHQLRAVATLATSLRRDRADLVHTHTPVGGLVGRAAAVVAGCRTIIHTFHGLPFQDDRPTPLQTVVLLLERLLATRTTYFFTQASGDLGRVARLGIARPADTLVIGNGVDVGRFAPDPGARPALRRELGLAADAIVVMTVARIVREKGLLELAQAAYELRAAERLHYVVIGGALPSDRTAVEATLDRHPVVAALGTRWRRLGYRADIDRLLRAADVFVLPTYREGLPRSVIEAMATGLPVIATDIPACRELVEPGRTGLLVPPRDPRALAQAIEQLSLDGALRRRMGDDARDVALARYDERVVLQRQMQVLGALLAR